MASFSEAAAGIVDRVGELGIGVGVFLNGLGIPGISEVLVPLGGVAVRRGQINVWSLFAICMVAQLAGVSMAYLIARYGGLALLQKYGKYVLISSRELEAAQRAFDRYGSRVVIFGAFIPGLQGFIGYVAGVAQMNFTKFFVSVFLGKLVWIGGLVYVGLVLGDHIAEIDRVIKQLGVLILAAMVGLGIWYVRRHRRHSKEDHSTVTQKESKLED